MLYPEFSYHFNQQSEFASLSCTLDGPPLTNVRPKTMREAGSDKDRDKRRIQICREFLGVLFLWP